MSMNNLTIDGEFRYIVQWFNEWSELQRDDFVPILVKFITGTNINNDDHYDDIRATTTPVNMNGLQNNLEFSGRPMSLFQCRIKLFNQWNRRWPTEFKEKLLQKITEIDSKIGEKINLALNPNNIEGLTNGYTLKKQHQHSLQQFQENAENLVNVTNCVSQVGAMALIDTMTDVLNNETSVDDIETNDDSMKNSIEQPLFSNSHYTDGNDVVADGNSNNDNKVCSDNVRQIHAINEREEPVEQVVQMQNLLINEEYAGKNHEDVLAIAEQKQPLPSVTVTVNPVINTQTISTNAEVPLVV